MGGAVILECDFGVLQQGGGQGAKPSSPYTSAYTYTVMAQHIAQLASALKVQGNWSVVAKDLVQDFHTNFFVATNNTYGETPLEQLSPRSQLTCSAR